MRSKDNTPNGARRYALVVPRASAAATGGAEAFCLSAARKLLESSHEAEVLTTCADDYRTWMNVHSEGESTVSGVPVRRFPVDMPRDPRRFDQTSAQLRYRLASLTDAEQENWLRQQGPYSTPMLQYIWANRQAYDTFVFFSYLYAPSYFGLPLVQERAALIPLAHDEWPIYMPIWKRLFDKPKTFLYVSPEEREFVRRRFPHAHTAGPICDVPVDVAEERSATRFRQRFNLHDPFLLYVGRIDESKGCGELVTLFETYLQTHPASKLHLVLAGSGEKVVRSGDRVHALGYVDDITKWDALSACTVFMMPSRNESLCISVLEAWAAGKPSLVNGTCAALVGQCRRANGGLWYTDQRSFDAALDALVSPKGEMLGMQGRAFFERRYKSGNVVESFAALSGDLQT